MVRSGRLVIMLNGSGRLGRTSWCSYHLPLVIILYVRFVICFTVCFVLTFIRTVFCLFSLWSGNPFIRFFEEFRQEPGKKGLHADNLSPVVRWMYVQSCLPLSLHSSPARTPHATSVSCPFYLHHWSQHPFAFSDWSSLDPDAFVPRRRGGDGSTSVYRYVRCTLDAPRFTISRPAGFALYWDSYIHATRFGFGCVFWHFFLSTRLERYVEMRSTR